LQIVGFIGVSCVAVKCEANFVYDINLLFLHLSAEHFSYFRSHRFTAYVTLKQAHKYWNDNVCNGACLNNLAARCWWYKAIRRGVERITTPIFDVV